MNKIALDGLRELLRGQLVTPEDPDYDAGRAVFNAMVDKRPAGVIRVAQVSDVIAGVNFARENSMPLAIRGGGHSAPGFGTWDDALVLDFVNRTGVRVDPQNSRARAKAVRPGPTSTTPRTLSGLRPPVESLDPRVWRA